MRNRLLDLLSLFLVRNVDSILSDLSRTIERLEKAVKDHDDLGAKNERKAQEFGRLADLAREEANRASRIVGRLKKLVD